MASQTETTIPEADRPVILIVEDEALTIMDLGDVLEEGGYDTVQCASAERALSMLRGAGIADARLQDGTAAGKPVWRLRVGPVAPGLVQELSARVAGLGFGAPHPVRE